MFTNVLDRLHRRLRANRLAYRLVIGTRILLFAGFLPTGFVKMLGRPFTIIDPSTPIGLFFHAMHQTGLYWRFLGASQVVASILLMIPATAHLGALLFFPIIFNIFIITMSMDFRGTPVVTGLMLLASLLLVIWDYPRWRGLVTTEPMHERTLEPQPLSMLERVAYAFGAVCGTTFFLGTRDLVPRSLGWAAFYGAAVAVIAVAILAFRRPASSLPTR